MWILTHDWLMIWACFNNRSLLFNGSTVRHISKRKSHDFFQGQVLFSSE